MLFSHTDGSKTMSCRLQISQSSATSPSDMKACRGPSAGILMLLVCVHWSGIQTTSISSAAVLKHVTLDMTDFHMTFSQGRGQRQIQDWNSDWTSDYFHFLQSWVIIVVWHTGDWQTSTIVYQITYFNFLHVFWVHKRIHTEWVCENVNYAHSTGSLKQPISSVWTDGHFPSSTDDISVT